MLFFLSCLKSMVLDLNGPNQSRTVCVISSSLLEHLSRLFDPLSCISTQIKSRMQARQSAGVTGDQVGANRPGCCGHDELAVLAVLWARSMVAWRRQLRLSALALATPAAQPRRHRTLKKVRFSSANFPPCRLWRLKLSLWKLYTSSSASH